MALTRAPCFRKAHKFLLTGTGGTAAGRQAWRGPGIRAFAKKHGSGQEEQAALLEAGRQAWRNQETVFSWFRPGGAGSTAGGR